jgi:trimeric autotransporter adhesin
MGSVGPARKRGLVRVLACFAVVIGALVASAAAAGPGGWDHLGDRGAPGTDSLDLVASALAVSSGAVYVGGEFTDAGGLPDADRIAVWNGSSWSAVSSSASQISNGRVSAIAVSAGNVYAGGNFTNAGGDADADFLAVWDGASWKPFCVASGHPLGGNVTSLQIVGQTLYVGGTFHDGAGIDAADSLLACSLANGAPSPAVADPLHPFSGPVYALAADSNGTLYAGGGFTDLEDIDAADNVASLPLGGAWHAMGTGAPGCGGCAIDDFVRGLTTVGTDVYVGTDAVDIAGIAQADHVAKWNGTEWSALGAGSGGGNGWFSTTTEINALTGTGSYLFATGTFLNANGDARADNIAFFDGTAWHPVGSDGAGNGPWSGNGLALALVDRQLYAAGTFTSAGGDPQAHSAASFALTQIIAYPTPTVTAGPGPIPTPTVTASPPPAPTPTVTPTPDVKPPATSLRRAQIAQSARKATFKFASGEPGSTFTCKLDQKRFTPCTSPKTYKRLAPGTHVFRVKARDRAGNLDATPAVKRFTIRKR